jgi:hypothetical protein
MAIAVFLTVPLPVSTIVKFSMFVGFYCWLLKFLSKKREEFPPPSYI